MNCQDITNLLDSRLSGDLTAVQQQRVGEHLLACESCEAAWRASQMLRSFADVLVPSPRPGLLEQTLRLAAATSRRSHGRSASFWLGSALGAALAASIAIVAVVAFDSPIGSKGSDAPAGLAIALYETRDITLAVDSAEGLADARIHVGLSGGIELAGRPGQRDLRWTADINAGINRLTIPIVAVSGEDAELLVEIEHSRKQRRFVVAVDVVPASTDSPVTG